MDHDEPGQSTVVVSLRPLTLADTDAVHSWASLPESCRYQGWGPNTIEETRAFVERALAAGPDRLIFAILVAGEVVGTAELRLAGPTTGELAYLVHPRHWGRGIATAAALALLRMGFGEHRRHRIFATCDPRNVASAAVLRKIGMRYEGRLRATEYIRDGWRDSDLYAILATD
jgi:RimJ/RimL family protein N-acetyltransferase